MKMTAAIEYILTAAESLGSQDCYKKSRMTILGLAVILFCENEQAQAKWIIIYIYTYVPKKILTWMLREGREVYNQQ